MVDRLLHGHVIDFIQLHYGGWYFPSFNIADSAITIGAALLILRRAVVSGAAELGWFGGSSDRNRGC